MWARLWVVLTQQGSCCHLKWLQLQSRLIFIVAPVNFLGQLNGQRGRKWRSTSGVAMTTYRPLPASVFRRQNKWIAGKLGDQPLLWGGEYANWLPSLVMMKWAGPVPRTAMLRLLLNSCHVLFSTFNQESFNTIFNIGFPNCSSGPDSSTRATAAK